MGKIKLSLDREDYWAKPSGEDVPKINNRIAGYVYAISPTEKELRDLAEKIGIDGHTFCPATFKNGKRSKENFEQQQFIALDFDNKDPKASISLDEAKARANHYGLPFLFAYDTLTSENHNKFRIVFLNNAPMGHRIVAEAVQLALGKIFPEADPLCYKDTSKMYFGGKELTYFDEKSSTIDVESVFRSMTRCLKESTPKHYKERLAHFSSQTGISLNENGLLDVTMSYDPTESSGAIQTSQNGEISPNAIIMSSNIKGNGEKSPKSYIIGLNESTSNPSVGRTAPYSPTDKKIVKNHKKYRSSDLKKIAQSCRLFREFRDGTRDMIHDELFGLSLSLMQVETGPQIFCKIQEEHPEFYDRERRSRWSHTIEYNADSKYKPQDCDKFCPYADKCKHGKNILTTAKPKRNLIERIPGYQEEFCSLEEMQEDVYNAILRAYHAEDTKVYVIKAGVGSGKSYSYLKIMSENPDDCFLVSTPTNLLKDEVGDRAEDGELEVLKTPSLDQIADELPRKVWNYIRRLRKTGRHSEVHPYIQQVLKNEDIPCLREYMEEREKLKHFAGSIITTHRYLMNMDRKRLGNFVCIIDEDILFKSIISNQETITISELKKLRKETTNVLLAKKIDKLLKRAKTQSLISVEGFDPDDDIGNDDDISFDVASFCRAEKIMFREKSKNPEDKNLKEDTICFIKPAIFFENMKYIVVSATADEKIYRQYFGAERVDFYECKQAKYDGRLLQYPGKSMSRSCINNNKGIVQKLMGKFGMKASHVITFMKENIGQLHFGNTEGSNSLEGEDILVVGTPYHAPFLYKLVAFTLGMDFDEDEEMEPQIIEHNGYHFQINTFKNENLRAIQLWMIESELEQAVGRARLLRNSCTVHLFARFPLRQSELIEDFDYKG